MFAKTARTKSAKHIETEPIETKQPQATWKLDLIGKGFVQQGSGQNRTATIYLRTENASAIACEALSRETLRQNFAAKYPEVSRLRSHREKIAAIQSKVSELQSQVDAITIKAAAATDVDESLTLNAEVATLATELDSLKRLEVASVNEIERLESYLKNASKAFITDRRREETEHTAAAMQAAKQAFEQAISGMPELHRFSDAVSLAHQIMNAWIPDNETLF